MNGEAGKGDSPRPLSIGFEKYGLNYDRVFKDGKVKPISPISHISVKTKSTEVKIPLDTNDVEQIEEKIKNTLGT